MNIWLIISVIASLITIFSVFSPLNKYRKRMLFKKTALIEVECMKISGGLCVIVKNVGFAPAKNVRVEAEEFKKNVWCSNLDVVFPCSLLETKQKIEIKATCIYDTRKEVPFVVVWDDTRRKDNKRRFIFVV